MKEAIISLIALALGLISPAFEWAGTDVITCLKDEYKSFVEKPDIVCGLQGALTNMKDMPLTFIAQYGGIGQYAVKKIAKKGISEKNSRTVGVYGAGNLITRIVMFGSHSSPPLPHKGDVADSLYG